MLCSVLENDSFAIKLIAAATTPATLHLVGREVLEQARSRTRRDERHNAVLLALDYVYRGLPAEERAVFRALAIFPWDFDAEAAAVVAGHAIPAGVVFDILTRLEAQSLIWRANSSSEQCRFQLPVAASVYAMARLTESGEVAGRYVKLADWLWERAGQLTQVYMLSSGECQWFIDRLSYLAIAVEWTWAAGTDNRHDLLAVLLAYFWLHNGRAEEGRALIARALTRDRASPYRSDLLTWTVWISELESDPGQVIESVGEAVAKARAAGNHWALVRALNTLATASVLVGDDAGAQRHYEEAIELAAHLDDDFGLALCSHVYAWFLMGRGDYEHAASTIAVTRADFAEQANPHQNGSYLFVRSMIELNLGRVAAAEDLLRSAAGIFLQTDPSFPYVVEGLALVALSRQQPRRCLALVTASAQLRRSASVSARVPARWQTKIDETRHAAAGILPTDEADRVRQAADTLTHQQLVSYVLDRTDILARAGSSGLTRREYEIARLVAEGMVNREIAMHLQIADSTVSSHIKRIYAKLVIRSRTQLAAWVAAAAAKGGRDADQAEEYSGRSRLVSVSRKDE